MKQQAFLVGIGCNTHYQVNISFILQQLLNRFGVVAMSQLIRTAPVGIKHAADFYNMVVYFLAEDQPLHLKAWFNQLETTLGRDRRIPGAALTVQPGDLDILHNSPPRSLINTHQVILDSYYLTIAEELLSYVGLAGSDENIVSQNNERLDTVSISVCGEHVGLQPKVLAISSPFNMAGNKASVLTQAEVFQWLADESRAPVYNIEGAD
ncbi:2-amino-4-hydroxy-6-hydroxymethyldihydropteridine diphosphokinase [Zooshikella harenae]|uniref:2-amino-4-hydroxy-6-hydroxymethyldihydropteridine diphosphokinase n=1 Tax=Zooshikella harenae TaxID=2827238 RepID=A0ABS5Z979_9GAMM|nr:2-amino-4-hydroxy-6-hydroxymethyldihydropteridine diphosphokinase [Zooshikella harenae]MBU2710545.1 2-amino-4-hydroxy-6-hydroxymethyldihydropteridine diphosphokinase [Zooshikella harenae]